MKKQIMASVCAFALAFSIPAAAFAADGDALEGVEVNGEPVVLANEAGDPTEPITVEENDGTVDVTIADDLGWNETLTGYDENDDPIYEKILESIEIKNAENVDVQVSNPSNADPDVYGEEAVKAYQDWYNQVALDKGKPMFTLEITGDVVDANKKAIVTFQLNKDVYGNKVITYYVLHENGEMQSKVVRVHADGTVRIDVDGFSMFTFMDVDDIQKYENLVEPQDGDELSPKTGF